MTSLSGMVQAVGPAGHVTQRRTMLPVLLLAVALPAGSARATFHFMQIEQIVAGVDGNPRAQAIQLRMRENAQERVSEAKLIAWDANGRNPVVLIDFVSDVTQDALGDRVLVASADFVRYSDPPLDADFILTHLIPESYLAAGSVTFENDEGTLIVWRFSWGGDAYLGSTRGALTNDGDGEFGPAWPAPLDGSGLTALTFVGGPSATSSNNAADYVVADAPAVLINNAGATFSLTPLNCPGGPEGDSDGDHVCAEDDNCPDLANPDQADGDDDGVGDACDGCPDDPDKVEPGVCDCGTSDGDDDADEVINCDDNCPEFGNPDQADSDMDGAGDACDACPEDAAKTQPGDCGCGNDDADGDDDSVADCLDNCTADPNRDQADADGDGAGDACDGCPNDPERTEPGDEGCAGDEPGENENDNAGNDNADNDNVSEGNDNIGDGNDNGSANENAASNDNAAGPNDNSASNDNTGGGRRGLCGFGMLPAMVLIGLGLLTLRGLRRHGR